jgi:two-component system, LytTR family, response regulator
MPLLSGFGVVEAIGVENLPAVVFVTAHDEHAIRAFEVDALDYVLKPIDRERFQKTLVRVRNQLDNANNKQLQHKLSALLRRLDESKERDQPSRFVERLAIKKSGRVVFLKVEDIDWISAHGNYIQINAQGQAHLLRETMDSIEQKLDPDKFVRLRRSTIARIERIRELQPLFNGEYVLTLKDGTHLTSSRRYRNNLDILLKN